jgi:hypothetical protein
LQRLTAALRVQDVQFEIVPAEDAGTLAEFRHRGVPIAFLPDGEPQAVGGTRPMSKRQCARNGRPQQYASAHHRFLLVSSC